MSLGDRFASLDPFPRIVLLTAFPTGFVSIGAGALVGETLLVGVGLVWIVAATVYARKRLSQISVSNSSSA